MTKSTAEKFWLFSVPSGEEITALYYQLIRGRLVLVNQAQVKIELSRYELNKTLKNLEMI